MENTKTPECDRERFADSESCDCEMQGCFFRRIKSPTPHPAPTETSLLDRYDNNAILESIDAVQSCIINGMQGTYIIGSGLEEHEQRICKTKNLSSAIQFYGFEDREINSKIFSKCHLA